ncbi:hypothetical protein MHK_004873 [Candidatus Magnetomorum sp. HK-1]|nr:hypothetical protein MHK_004873 [Candidatus Magnetomorum sp. HK-1]
MKINIEYFSNLLDIFLEAKTAHIDIPIIRNAGIKIENEQGGFDEEFFFHLQIALENELISNRDLKFNGLKSIGITIGADGDVVLTDTPIRLTQKGHDFANALREKEILIKLKSEFKNAPFKMIFEGSQKLMEHFLKKKIDTLMSS